MKENKDCLIIFKNGKFYNCYKDDAIIISYLFDYKIIKNDKCGFPETILNKVIMELDFQKIDYQIISKDSNPLGKRYDNLNSYHKILKSALEYIEIKGRIKRIQEKINEITDINTLEKILGVLENELC